MNKKIQDAFNGQINAELYSSYLYLSMGAWAETQNLKGMAQWMRLQADEERAHAMKFYDFINDRDGTVILAPIDGPRTEWSSALEAFEETYAHECKVSGLINDLLDLTIAEKDHAASAFLQWFVTEQVEEEATAMEVIGNFKLAADNAPSLLILDRELGQRSAAPAGNGGE